MFEKVLLKLLVDWINPAPIKRPNPLVLTATPSNDTGDVTYDESSNPPVAERKERLEYVELRKSLYEEFRDLDDNSSLHVDSEVPPIVDSSQQQYVGAASPYRGRKSQQHVVCCYGLGPHASKRNRSENRMSEGRLSDGQDVDARHKLNMERRVATDSGFSQQEQEPVPQEPVVMASRSAVKRQRSEGRPSGNDPVDQRHALRMAKRLDSHDECEQAETPSMSPAAQSMSSVPDSSSPPRRQLSIERDEMLFAAQSGDVFRFDLCNRQQKVLSVQGRVTKKWNGAVIGVRDTTGAYVTLPPDYYVFTSVIRIKKNIYSTTSK